MSEANKIDDGGGPAFRSPETRDFSGNPLYRDLDGFLQPYTDSESSIKAHKLLLNRGLSIPKRNSSMARRRDRFAIAALQGILASQGPISPDKIAELSVAQADAMMAALAEYERPS